MVDPAIRVLVDWDADGWVLPQGDPSDPLNTLVQAPWHTHLGGVGLGYNNIVGGWTATTSNVLWKYEEYTEYGIYRWETVTDASGEGMVFGSSALAAGPTYTIDLIPVTAGNTYTACLWAKVASGTREVTFSIQGATVAAPTTEVSQGSQTVTLNTSWQKLTVTFTAGASIAYIMFKIITTGAGTHTLSTTGLFLAGGSTVPLYYNVGSTVGLYDDITDYVVDASWDAGIGNSYKNLADDGQATLNLDNVTKLFSPEYTGGALYGYHRPGLRVIIQLYNTDTAAYQTMWVGFTERFSPKFGLQAQTCAVRCNQNFLVNDKAKVNFPQPGTATNTFNLVTRLLQYNTLNVPAFTPKALVGHARAGTAAIVGGGWEQGTSDTGSDHTSLFPGRDWSGKITIGEALRRLVDAELAWCYLDRDGHIIVRSRDAFTAASSYAADINVGDIFNSADYAFGEDFVNAGEVITEIDTEYTYLYFSVGGLTARGEAADGVTVTPTVATEGFDSLFPIAVPAGQAVKILVDIPDNYLISSWYPYSGGNLPASPAISPVDGSGNVTASCTFITATQVLITITNAGATNYAVDGVYGVAKATKLSTERGIRKDGAGSNSGAQGIYSTDNDLLDSLAYIDTFLTAVLDRIGTAYGVVKTATLSFRDLDWLQYQLNWTLGTVLRLSDDQTGITNSRHVVVKEAHEWSQGFLQTTLTLANVERIS